MVVDGVVYMRILIVITPVGLDVIFQFYQSYDQLKSSSLPTISLDTPGNKDSQIVFVLSGWVRPFSERKNQG